MPLSLINLSMGFLLGTHAPGTVPWFLRQSLKLGAVTEISYSVRAMQSSSLLNYVSIGTSQKYFLRSFVTLFVKGCLLAGIYMENEF